METVLSRFEEQMNGPKRLEPRHSLEKLIKYVDDNKIILIETKSNGQIMLVSVDNIRKKFSYCYNTGRWRTYNNKWYRSKSTEDFIERFVLNENKMLDSVQSERIQNV
jgi:hypothetical protein